VTPRVFIILTSTVLFWAVLSGWTSEASRDSGTPLQLLAHAGEKAEPSGVEQEPGLDALLEANSGALFGGKASFKDGRVTLRYTEKRLFGRDFRSKVGKGMVGVFSAPEDIKNTLVKADLTKEAPGFSFAGIGNGRAVSNFALAGDVKLSFKLKVPTLLPTATLIVRWNQKTSRSYIQTSFFQRIVAVHKGRKLRAAATDSRFLGPPLTWFDRKSKGVPIEIVFQNQRAAISITGGEAEKPEKVEVVSLAGIESPSSGKILFQFANISFLIADLAIEGDYDRSWAEAALADLRREGKFKTPAVNIVATKEKGGTGIEQPDPEADDEL